jgi:hypothetical protein
MNWKARRDDNRGKRNATKEREMQYVIERMNDTAREWWNGVIWSDVDTDAKWYENRTDAETEATRIGGDITGFETD